METTNQKIAINILYIGLIATTVFGLAPSILLQILAVVILILLIGFANICKARDSKDGLMSNHITYLLRTVSLGSIILLISTIVAGLYAMPKANNNSLESAFGSGGMPENLDLSGIMSSYTKDNMEIFGTASLISMVPTAIYCTYRIANGYARAMKGYRIANPKSWF